MMYLNKFLIFFLIFIILSADVCDWSFAISYEPPHVKTNNLVFRPGLTQTGLYSHRSRLEA